VSITMRPPLACLSSRTVFLIDQTRLENGLM
jgi:hypothetical protein